MNKQSTIRFGVLLAVCIGALLPRSGSIVVPQAYAESAARTTAFPSVIQPDQVCLTWSADPTSTQTVQ